MLTSYLKAKSNFGWSFTKTNPELGETENGMQTLLQIFLILG